MKRALITGITGQDGSYLAKFLLDKGYEVAGIYRRTSHKCLGKLERLQILDKVKLYRGDLLDQSSIISVLQDFKPDELYNLAAQSFVTASFEQPILTAETTGLGVLRVLEAVRQTNPQIKIYQPSSSELFGKKLSETQNEQTPFYPRSPYGVSKLFGHWISINYRESYNMFICCGILFNHESPLRGLEFVTRKITAAVARIKHGKQDVLKLGNLEAKRDWGYAYDFVEAMWLMLQQEEPKDYVIATGETHSVREFLELAFSHAGLDWKKYVEIDQKLLRPAEVKHLLGDFTKAKEELGWKPKVTFESLAKLMVDEDMKLVEEGKL